MNVTFEYQLSDLTHVFDGKKKSLNPTKVTRHPAIFMSDVLYKQMYEEIQNECSRTDQPGWPKFFKVMDKDGIVYYIQNLTRFCKDRNIPKTQLYNKVPKNNKSGYTLLPNDPDEAIPEKAELLFPFADKRTRRK